MMPDETLTPRVPIDAEVEIVVLRHLNANRVDEYLQIADSAPAVRVQRDVADRIIELWHNLPSGYQSRCHVPKYGLRFLLQGESQCEASICWECDNIFGRTRDATGGASWTKFHVEFSAGSEVSQALLSLVKEFCPGSGSGSAKPE